MRRHDVLNQPPFDLYASQFNFSRCSNQGELKRASPSSALTCYDLEALFEIGSGRGSSGRDDTHLAGSLPTIGGAGPYSSPLGLCLDQPSGRQLKSLGQTERRQEGN